MVSFRLPLDTALLAQGETLEVDRWINLDGNKLHIQALELYPTHARLLLEEEPTNRGVPPRPGLLPRRWAGEPLRSRLQRRHGFPRGRLLVREPLLLPDRNLTLCITGAEWLEKGKEYVTVDLETGRALTPLPVDVRVSARRDGDNAEVAFYAPMPPEADEDHLVFRQLGTMDYRAPDGSTVAITGVTSLPQRCPVAGAPPTKSLCRRAGLSRSIPSKAVSGTPLTWACTPPARLVLKTPVSVPLA